MTIQRGLLQVDDSLALLKEDAGIPKMDTHLELILLESTSDNAKNSSEFSFPMVRRLLLVLKPDLTPNDASNQVQLPNKIQMIFKEIIESHRGEERETSSSLFVSKDFLGGCLDEEVLITSTKRTPHLFQ